MNSYIEHDGIKFYKDKQGYYVGYSKGIHNIRLHRYIWEEHNCTKIPKGYVIHHKDEDKGNNDLYNLILMTRAAHTILHMTGNKNPRYGVKEDPEHIKSRIDKVSETRRTKATSEMIEDIKNGITQRAFKTKYKLSSCQWQRFRTEQGIGDNKSNPRVVITPEMIEDVKNGMTSTSFTQRYHHRHPTWKKIHKELEYKEKLG